MTVTSIAASGTEGVTISGSPITTSGTINVGLGDISPNSVTINQAAGLDGLTFAHASHIRGDFSTGGFARTLFQTSVPNSKTAIAAVPNGTPLASQYSGFTAYGDSSATNNSYVIMGVNEASGIVLLNSNKNGTGTLYPLNLTVGNPLNGITIETTGNTTVKNALNVLGFSTFASAAIGSSTASGALSIHGAGTSHAELYMANSFNGSYIEMNTGNNLIPAEIIIANKVGTPSLEYYSNDNVSAPATFSINGPGQNGDIQLTSSNSSTGNTTTILSAQSFTALNDVSMNIIPQNAGTINVTRLNVATPFTTVNSVSGNATMIAGSVTVSTSAVTANSVILLAVGNLGTVTTPKVVHWTSRVPGTSFDIISEDLADTSTVSWFIIG